MRKPSLLFRVPSGEHPLEFLGDETAGVDFDGSPGYALGGNGVSQGGERYFIGEECIPPLSKQSEAFCDTVTIAVSDGDQVVPRRMKSSDKIRQDLNRGCGPSTSTVSKGDLKWKRPRTFSIGDRRGFTRTTAPSGDWVGVVEGSDLE